MKQRASLAAELAATLASATLAGITCCGPVLLQWLGLAVWTIGGRTLLLGLVHYEIPILGVIAGAAFLSRTLARDPLTRWANTVLAAVAATFMVLRVTWEVRRGVVMALDPVVWLFTYRQTVLLAAAGLVFAARLARLLGALWQRGQSAPVCRVVSRRVGRRPTAIR